MRMAEQGESANLVLLTLEALHDWTRSDLRPCISGTLMSVPKLCRVRCDKIHKVLSNYRGLRLHEREKRNRGVCTTLLIS